MMAEMIRSRFCWMAEMTSDSRKQSLAWLARSKLMTKDLDSISESSPHSGSMPVVFSRHLVRSVMVSLSVPLLRFSLAMPVMLVSMKVVRSSVICLTSMLSRTMSGFCEPSV